jgi:NAD(P)-dependent dehydrogenase (short-subunit alcohol dehydrogenase family)
MKNALITGASRGLGRALARKLAEDGWGLVIDARSRKALDEARAELSARNSGPSGILNLVAIPGSITTESHRKKLTAAARKLGGLDAVTFSGGIGENRPRVRAMVCERLEAFGVVLDRQRNQDARGYTRISADQSSVSIWIVPADEERIVARATAEVIIGR